MAVMNDVVRLAVDAYNGRVTKYSVGDSMDTLRQALVEANNGSTVLNYKDIRDGKCVGLFTLVEEILLRTVVEGLQESDFFYNLVDFRNLSRGDKNIFVTEDSTLFVVSDIADGTQGLRRQRLGGYNQVSMPTVLKGVKIYEEMDRVLSGQVDFNYFINKVAESFRQQLLNDIYALWGKASSEDFGGATFFPAAGAYDEDALLDVIAHVEAAAGGKPATILGTKKAIRNLDVTYAGEKGKEDMYNLGFAGKFYGTNVVATPQRHKIGSIDFVFPDNQLTIIAGDEKPIKCVYEGQSTIIMGNPIDKQDLTHEYMYTERIGLGIITAGGNSGIGRYEIA